MPNETSTTSDAVFAHLRAIEAKVDASRAEGELRGEKTNKELERLTDGLETLNSRMTGAEGAIANIRKENGKRADAGDILDLIRAGELGDALGKLVSLESTVERAKGQLDTQDRVQRGIVGALGLDYDELASRAEDGKKLAAPKVTLKTLSREQKATAVVTMIILALQAAIALAKHL